MRPPIHLRQTPFSGLTPEVVLQAVDSVGFQTDGRLMALNSYENRVYRVGVAQIEGVGHPQVLVDAVIVKFYRQGRWSDAAILEEHQFAIELATAELPVAAPCARQGLTLHQLGGFRFAVFDAWRGVAPELSGDAERELLGRSLGRLHARAALRAFEHRPNISHWQCGEPARQSVLQAWLQPEAQLYQYEQISAQLVRRIQDALDAAGPYKNIRLHGDCHLGNILWNEQGPVFVDLDDCLTGPAVQDLWLLSAGDQDTQLREWSVLLEGYRRFAQFDVREAALVEALRGLRMLRHAAWILERWNDPAFPRAFPWFGESRYWDQHLQELAEQIEVIDAPPLAALC